MNAERLKFWSSVATGLVSRLVRLLKTPVRFATKTRTRSTRPKETL